MTDCVAPDGDTRHIVSATSFAHNSAIVRLRAAFKSDGNCTVAILYLRGMPKSKRRYAAGTGSRPNSHGICTACAQIIFVVAIAIWINAEILDHIFSNGSIHLLQVNRLTGKVGRFHIQRSVRIVNRSIPRKHADCPTGHCVNGFSDRLILMCSSTSIFELNNVTLISSICIYRDRAPDQISNILLHCMQLTYVHGIILIRAIRDINNTALCPRACITYGHNGTSECATGKIAAAVRICSDCP